VKTLSDYLDEKTLRQLQDAFSAVAQAPVRICRPDGEAFVRAYTVRSDWDALLEAADGQRIAKAKRRKPRLDSGLDVPVVLRDEVVGRVRIPPEQVAAAGETPPGQAGPGAAPWTARLLRLMAAIVARLCDREDQLRTRIEELATLYRLTSEFTGQRDLQGLLDLVAQTVVRALGMKACSIRLLSEDGRELLVKAVANLSSDYLNKGPILVSQSLIDQEALRTLKPVYIADERTDPRVLYPAEARREGIVSALCAPLIYRGKPEGMIRVYSSRKHVFDWFEVSLLQAIAGEAAAAIVNARLYQEAIRSANVQRQLSMAADVQKRMIPSRPPQIPGFELATIYVPSLELGGDFFDFIHLPPDNHGLAICDVVGKGVRASLLMASIRASLRAHASNIYDMSEVLRRVNRDLCSDTLSSDFATMFYAVLDQSSRRLTYANAGHMPPLLLRGGKVCHLGTGGGVLGIDPEMHFGHDAFVLQGGDVVFAYTDGLSEAMNFEDVAFGRERVEKAALAAIEMGRNAEGIAKHVLWEMRRFAGLQTRLDDLTIVVLKAL